MKSQPSVVTQMVWKDMQLHRSQIVITTICGAVALAALLLKRESVTVVGSVVLFVALIFISCMLPGTNILNERKKQNLPFLMSLPISSIQYTTAKLVGTLAMFMIPWLTLAIGAIVLITVQNVLPHGVIPLVMILLALPFIGLCIIMGTTLVGETEGWMIASNLICNSSYGLGWYFIARNPALMHDLRSNQPVWNSAVRTFLATEFSVIFLVLALTYFLQSRKRDFV